jgi:4-amino-4-deoxy-L-arabinose transferase-like glycosyltransferase
MSLPRSFIKAATPIASIFLILAGIIQLRAQVWIGGAICLVLALIGFILSIRLLENRPLNAEEIDALRPLMIPVLLWTIVICLLGVSVFYVADNFVSVDTNRVAAVTWVCSVILGSVVVWGKQLQTINIRSLQAGIRANRVELILLLAIVLLAFALRTIDLTTHPYPWSGDEASVGKEALRIINEEVTNFFDVGWSLQPNWSFVPTAITELIFGNSILAIRLTSALAGTLAVLFIYLAARELFNPAIALMAAAFLATLPYNVHFSRIGVQNVVDSLMSSFVFWLLAKAMKTSDRRYYYSAGAVAGLTIYTYAGTKLVLILAVAILFFFIIRQRSYLFSHWRHLLSFLGGSVISAAPQAAFFARHPDIFIGRLGQEGILFNGWLTQQAAQTGKSVAEILFNQFTRTTMVFIATPALGNFFNSPYPYLTILGSILFLLGMAYALAYFWKPQHFILLIWFWAVILFGGILTLNPPANTRLLMTTPAVSVFMALGTYKIVEYLQRFRLVPQRVVVPIFLVIVSVISYQNIKYYMFEYRNNMYFQDANGEYAMEVGLMAKKMGSDVHLYILGEPRVYSSFPTLSYIAPDNPRTDVGIGNIAALVVNRNERSAFFATPESRPLLAQIVQMYPGGMSGLVYRKTKPNEILFEYYILNP